MYEFIDSQRDPRDGSKYAYPVRRMCTWLDVSRSGFYDWRGRPNSATVERRERLKELISEIFRASDETYGYRRVHAELDRRGVPAGPELVRALMRELDLVTCQPRPFRPTTTIAGDAHTIPDLVDRDFSADMPGAKMIGDITYIPTWEGWLYLATVIDCYSKKVIGYAMADHLRTELVCDALSMAARNQPPTKDAIFHSDRGCQYTSALYAAHAKKLAIRRSMGRTGVCYDNAAAEAFNATLKVERVHRMTYPTRRQARGDITRWIELRYNQKRLHSALGYRTPNEVHTEYTARKAA
jgi:putative transposase